MLLSTVPEVISIENGQLGLPVVLGVAFPTYPTAHVHPNTPQPERP